MNNYIIELSVIHLVLAGGYWLLLRKEQQYGITRFYLLTSTVLALIIPVLKLPKLSDSQNVAITEVIQTELTPITTIADTFTWADLFTGIYAAVSLFFLIKFLHSIFYLVRLHQRNSYEECDGFYLHSIPDLKGSFTFFNSIFISHEIRKDEHTYEMMLEHEKAHVFFRHTYDIMFIQLFQVFFWWLPSSWLVNNEIRKIHEYQADAYVLKSYRLEEYASILINSTLRSSGLTLASSFYEGFILKRLAAMRQAITVMSSWRLGALVATGIALVIVFACTEEHERIELSYPQEALRARVEGRVDVQFVVEKDGSLSDVKVIKGIGAECDAEAMRIVQNTSFQPATQQGKQVRIRMVMPVIFKLSDKSIAAEAAQPKNSSFTVSARYDNGLWSGKVYDEEGGGLPGVNVTVAGATSGTVSDVDGAFKLKGNESEDLLLSFAGYETIKLKGK